MSRAPIFVQVKHDLHRIPQVLSDTSQKAVKQAVARSLTETSRWVKSKGAAIIKTRVNLPINGSSRSGAGLRPPGIKSLINANPVRYSASAPLSTYAVKVALGARPISLIHFLTASKKRPILQKGRLPHQRLPKRLVAKINSQKQSVLTGAFVQRSRGALQVWRRRSTRKIEKQSYRSLWDLIGNDAIGERLRGEAQARYQAAITRNMAFYMSRVGKR